jgi:hypothetical protein
LKSADQYFSSGQYKKAWTDYSLALAKNQLSRKLEKHEYYYALFRIAESKRLNGDSTCTNDYKKLTNEYSKESHIDQDKRILPFVAESYTNLGQYWLAETYYHSAIEQLDSIPDHLKFGYAFCSLQLNRFGQSLQLLNEIKNKTPFEPKFSLYKSKCDSGIAKNISRELKQGDTLHIAETFKGCESPDSYKYDIVKQADDYKIITYKSRQAFVNAAWEIDTVRYLPEASYNMITNYESELRSFSQYKNPRVKGWSNITFTSGAETFSFYIYGNGPFSFAGVLEKI